MRKRIGFDQVRVDICYITPGGRRLRTFPEIQRHLDLLQEGTGGQLTIEHFTFSKKVDLGETLDTDKVVFVCVTTPYLLRGVFVDPH